MNAILTNSIGDAIYSLLLLYFSFDAGYRFIKKDPRFSLAIALVFFNLFVLFGLGAVAHYLFAYTQGKQLIWLAIGILVVFYAYLLTEALRIPLYTRLAVMLFSLVIIYFYIVNLLSANINYLYIAFLTLMLYCSAIYYTKNWVRLGFIMVIFSNLIWIASAKLMLAYFGSPIPPIYAYHNDLYHLLLIVSTLVIYKGILKGGWPLPDNRS